MNGDNIVKNQITVTAKTTELALEEAAQLFWFSWNWAFKLWNSEF